MKKSFLLFSLNRFSYKFKEHLKGPRKIYSWDNGFIKERAFKFSPDWGTLYENVVAQELKKKEAVENYKVYYWKNQQNHEVDFLIKKGPKVTQLIQVCYNLKNEKTKERETRSLIRASKEFFCKELLLINSDVEKIEKIKVLGMEYVIKFIPLWKWLLNKNSF